jgi:hypothetical protein
MNMARILFSLATVFASTTAHSLELATVLENTLVSPPQRVEFIEERSNRMLKEALILEGYLEYLEAGRLRKVVESPFQESLLIDNDRIEIEREGDIKVLSTRRSRSLRVLLGGIEAILAGQVDQLESVFDYEISGSEEAWVLQLHPRSKRVAKQLIGLTVLGTDEKIASIRVELKNNEIHDMRLIRNEAAQ